MSEDRIDVEAEARVVAEVLREYAAKLAEYNTDMLSFLEDPHRVHPTRYSKIAWLLDRFEMINRPLQRILSRGSGLVENSPLIARTHDEMNLRMRELEAQLHHAERQTRHLHELLEKGKHAEAVAKLRYAAGLPLDRSLAAKRA